MQVGLKFAFLVAVLAAAGGCSIAGESDERDRAGQAGAPYELPFERRELPALPPKPTRVDILVRAFAANPGLERAYFAWRAALERVPQEAAPDLPTLSFETLFTREKMSAWDRTTLGASQMIPFPGKLEKRGQIALDDAIAARRRFEDAKFMLQADAIEAYENLEFADRTIAIGLENVALLRQFVDITRTLVGAAKARQIDLSKAELELAGAENAQKSNEANRATFLARINTLLARPAATPLEPMVEDVPFVLPADDAFLFSLAAERNPELAAMAAEVRGRENALDLARKAWLPDFGFSFTITGGVEKMLGAMVTLPLQFGKIRAGIDEAKAGIRAAQAALRERTNDVKAQLVLQVYLARDGDRRLGVLQQALLPKAKEIVESTREAYGTGGASFLELLDAQRALLELRLEQAELEAMRRSAAARLEALCALDFGTLKKEDK